MSKFTSCLGVSLASGLLALISDEKADLTFGGNAVSFILFNLLALITGIKAIYVDVLLVSDNTWDKTISVKIISDQHGQDLYISMFFGSKIEKQLFVFK